MRFTAKVSLPGSKCLRIRDTSLPGQKNPRHFKRAEDEIASVVGARLSSRRQSPAPVDGRMKQQSIIAEQRPGRTFFNHPPCRIKKPKAADGIKLDLPAKHFPGFRFRAATDGLPVESSQPGLLNLELGVHLYIPLNRRPESVQPIAILDRFP